MQSVVDHHSNPDVHIERAVQLLAGSEGRRLVFRAVYFGKKAHKTVQEIAASTGLEAKTVLTHGKRLATHGFVLQDGSRGHTKYGKIGSIMPFKDRILQLANDPKKAKATLNTRANTTNVYGGIHVGDKYVTGQAGAVGPNSKAKDVHFQQIWNSGSIATADLARELALLRQHLKNSPTTIEHDLEIGRLAEAEQAAIAGHGSKALSILKNVGTWVLDGARDLGVAIAAEAISKAQQG